ncbi:hypothetical protein M1105_01470 [Limibaculum sp. FT325]|uniref:hypothetical protein n=1 Tax=Thermohalobaculum sediminis TaxID=2939436 RepID=UPI0020BE3109|nr:hypothetical protein [Limibaculum sediminis]MCL5775665.1 hypothetical protein [Limibaculum sediminis]
MAERDAGARLLEAGSSHLYPGARLRVEAPSAGDCLVAFADGARAGGRLAALDAGGWRLDLGTYRTARGRAIGPKAWRLAAAEGGGLRVTARLD